MSDMLARLESTVPALRRYARSLLRDVQDADDLVHDTLGRALDTLHRPRAAADLRAWLFTIMHNLFVSNLRRARVRRTEPLDDEAADIHWMPPSQEESVHAREILRALSALPEDQRQVILLVSVEDFSYAEAASVLGVPVGTVMSRLSRGRERLRQLVREHPEPRAALRRVK